MVLCRRYCRRFRPQTLIPALAPSIITQKRGIILHAGGGGTWSVETPPKEVEAARDDDGDVAHDHDVAPPALPAPPASTSSFLGEVGVAEALASEAFEAWDEVTTHDMSLSYWSNATSLQMPGASAATAAAAEQSSSSSSSSHLAPGARAFLGLDFMSRRDDNASLQRDGDGDEYDF